MYDIVIHFFLRLCSIYSYDEMLAIFPMLYKYILAVYFIHNSMHLYLLPLYCPYPPWNIIYSLKTDYRKIFQHRKTITIYLYIKAGSIICTNDFSFCVFSCISQAFYNTYVLLLFTLKKFLKPHV